MKRRIPRDFSTVSLFSMAAKGLQLVVTILLVRLLPVGDYAGFTVFFTVSSTILGVTSQSLALAYVRYNTEKLTEGRGGYRDWLIGLAHILNTLCFVVMLWTTYPIASVMGVSSILILAAIVYGFLLGVVQLNIAFLESRGRYAKSGLIENVKQLVLLAAVTLAISGFPAALASVVVAYCAAGAIGVAFSTAFIGNAIRGREISLHFDAREVGVFLSSSIWLILYSATTQLFNQVNVTMLSVLGTQYEVAEYGVASKYYNMILLLLPSIKTVLRVRMSSAEMTNSTRKQMEFSAEWVKRTFAVIAGGIALCIAGAEFLFPILNGAQYSGAVGTFQILCVGALFAYLLAPSSALIMSLNRYKTQLSIGVLALAINVLGNYVLIPPLGASGTAIATVSSQIVLNLLMTVVVFWVGMAGQPSK